MTRLAAVITGASSGIGAGFARALAPTHDLLLVARRRERLDALAAELTARGSVADVLAADLTDEAGLSAVADRIAAQNDLDLLVNSAGFGLRGLFWATDLEAQQRMHRLHVTATVRLSHAALRNMTARGSGNLINVASVAAFMHRPGSVSYGATKSWMTAFTETLYLELKSIGSAVKVQALCPGFTYSEFHDIMHVDRRTLGSPSLWLRADQVVDASLKGLTAGKLFVVPGWRYGLLVALLTKLPASLRLALESAAATKRSKRSVPWRS